MKMTLGRGGAARVGGQNPRTTNDIRSKATSRGQGLRRSELGVCILDLPVRVRGAKGYLGTAAIVSSRHGLVKAATRWPVLAGVVILGRQVLRTNPDRLLGGDDR